MMISTTIRIVKTFVSSICCTDDLGIRSLNCSRHSVVANSNNQDTFLETNMQAAQTVWNYMVLDHDITKSDIILVLGNNDLRTAEYAAELFLKGLADWLVFSGKDGALTKGKWVKTEAEVFRDVAVTIGVPNDKIILETDATNTGDNIRYSYDKLFSMGIQPSSVILVHTPYMERRSYATFKKQWGNPNSVTVKVTSPKLGLEEFPNDDVGSVDDIITVMIGCLQRIISYPKKGFQIYQDIPKEVTDAYETLLNSGLYDNHLLKSCS